MKEIQKMSAGLARSQADNTDLLSKRVYKAIDEISKEGATYLRWSLPDEASETAVCILMEDLKKYGYTVKLTNCLTTLTTSEDEPKVQDLVIRW